jgi:hypothetical protein
METHSDFEKELELEVVKEEDPLEELFRQVQIEQQGGRLPTNTTDALEQAALRNKRSAAEDEHTVTLDRIDTLREEEECPYGMGNDDCGLEKGSCSVCGYEAPPEGLDDPDLTKARAWDQQEEQKQKMKEIRERTEKLRSEHEQSKLNRPGRPSFARMAATFELSDEELAVVDSALSVYTSEGYEDSVTTDAIRAKLRGDFDRWDTGGYGGYKIETTKKMSPAKSKSQFRLMKGICEGNIEPTDGITKKVACEFVKNHQSPKGLPEKVKKKEGSVQQVQFLYELIGNGFDQYAEKFIQDEIDAGRDDKDLMEAYGVLQMQGPEAFREFAFKGDPLGMDMVEQLYGDDSPEDNPDPMEMRNRRQEYERNRRDFERKHPRDPRGPATPGNWDVYRGQY